MDPEDSPRTSMPVRRRVTAAMVAEHAGVSTATVSLVANGKTRGRVSAGNEARVLQSIRDLGYVVDGIGSSLARGVSSTVIMVAPDISNPFFAKVIAGVRSALGSDYQLLLSVTDAGLSPSAEETRRLLSLRPAGLIIDAPSPAYLADLSNPLPLVVIDAPDAPEEIPAVNLDVAQGARLMAAHFADQGHRTVAYLDASTGTATLTLRRKAFLAAATAHGIEVPETAVASSTIDVGSAAAQFTRHWPQWQAAGVTAVACATDTHAYGVIQEARVAGLRIPEDLAIAGFDDLPYSATMSPGLTSVHLDAETVGMRAATQLRQLMAGEELDTVHVLTESWLVVRGSTVGA